MKTTTIARLHAKAVLPALLMANMAEATVADRSVSAVMVGHFSEQDNLCPSGVVDTETRQTRAYAEPVTEWTKAMTLRFGELTRLEALGTIAPGELNELEQLANNRRNLQYPRPADEVLWEINQRQVTTNLVQALKEYVHFHQAPRRARAGAR
jgi:hypothetical protein